MNIKALGTSVLFTFMDKVNKTNGVEHFVVPTSTSGIVIAGVNLEDQTKKPRWAKVLAVGSSVKEITVGEYVLIAPMRWTPGVVFEGSKIWKTDEKEVLLSSSEPHYD